MNTKQQTTEPTRECLQHSTTLRDTLEMAKVAMMDVAHGSPVFGEPVRRAIKAIDAALQAQTSENLRCKSVQKRLATMWGFVPAQAPAELDQYDAGLLSDFGGGNVDWWQEYIRAELERAYDFYQSQCEAPAAVAVPDDLKARCAEILDWQWTGILTGNALRDFAAAHYSEHHDALQMAERTTAREAYAALAAAPAQAVLAEAYEKELSKVSLRNYDLRMEKAALIAALQSQAQEHATQLAGQAQEAAMQIDQEKVDAWIREAQQAHGVHCGTDVIGLHIAKRAAAQEGPQ